MREQIRILGHRGAQTDDEKARKDPFLAKLPAENTLASIQYALANHADGIEIDVVRTADDRLVIIHSANLNEHVFDDRQEELLHVGEYTLEQLRCFYVGPRKDGVIPELSEVLALIKKHQGTSHNSKLILNIELKDVKGTRYHRTPEKTDTVDLLIDRYLKDYQDLYDHILVSSFALNDLIKLHQMQVGLKLGFLFKPTALTHTQIYTNDDSIHALDPTIDNIERVLECVPSLHSLHPFIGDVTEGFVSVAHAKNLGMYTWHYKENTPAQELETIYQLLVLNMRYPLATIGIITNFSKEFHELLMQGGLVHEVNARVQFISEDEIQLSKKGEFRKLVESSSDMCLS